MSLRPVLVEMSAKVKIVLPGNWKNMSKDDLEKYLLKHGLPKITHDIVRSIKIKFGK